MATDDSNHLRNQGNQKYQEAHVAGITPEDKQALLHNALTWYKRAIETAITDDETASAAKNFSKAAWDIAKLIEAQNGDTNSVQHHYQLALSNLNIAFESGRTAKKNKKWIKDISQSYDTCLHDCLNMTKKLSNEIRVKFLTSILSVMKTGNRRQICLQELAQALYDQGCEIMDSKKHGDALYALKECQQCLQEVISGEQEQIVQAANVLQKDVRSKLVRAEALQLLDIGIKLLDELDNKDEDTKVDNMYEAIDSLRQAEMKSKERDLDVEAQANAYLGKLYDTILNHVEKAKHHYNICLALSSDCQYEAWHRESTEALRRYQRKDDLKRRTNTKYGDSSLDLDIKALCGAREEYDDADFLHFVFNQFPPKTRQPQMPDLVTLKQMTPKQRQKPVTKFVMCYHPDKQRNLKDGDEKWPEVCDEITKELNAILEKR